MLQLFCAIVGVAGESFSVRVDEDDVVDEVKKAIRAQQGYMFPASKLRLFLARRGTTWLKDDDEAAVQLNQQGGQNDPFVQTLIKGEHMKATRTLQNVFAQYKMEDVATGQIHVLVVAPLVTIHEIGSASVYHQELEYYQRGGEVIRRNCEHYCETILNKIDSHYHCGNDPLPFVCVEGSSGMGKSQLAFALGGRRPYFYWPVSSIGSEVQHLYRNFDSISRACRNVTLKDDPTARRKEEVLNSLSNVYKTEELWTYGFIRALLEHCSTQQHRRMIRFEESTSLYVAKCNVGAVTTVRDRMKEEEKLLPFFILDEMTPKKIDAGGTNMAAFQRNVFRACGLIVLVMGTDAKMTELIDHSGGSYKSDHLWMTIVSRFPPHQLFPLEEGKQRAWDEVVAQYPVINDIVVGSRGRFARYFMDSVADYVTTSKVDTLYDLLDEAFGQVSVKTQKGKRYMNTQEGRNAQLAAISYPNCTIQLPLIVEGDEFGPPRKKSKHENRGTHCMHVHFANLVDAVVTDVTQSRGRLEFDYKRWLPSCRFPEVEEDLLLYLAVLGGKTYSGYYDHHKAEANSTKHIFSMYVKATGSSLSANTNAKTSDYAMYKNLAAHAIFCVSRRNGVQGIAFNDFFSELLGEFQDAFKQMTMTTNDSNKTIVAGDLFSGCAALTKLAGTQIPFLAPPNAKWPQCILNSRGHGCNFGHLVRSANKKICDVYV